MQNKIFSTYPTINKGKTGFHLKLSINSLTIALMNYFSDLWITMTSTQNRSCPHSNLSGKSCSQSPWTLLFTSPKHYILGIRPMQTKLFSPIRASPNIRGGPPETRNQPLHHHSHSSSLWIKATPTQNRSCPCLNLSASLALKASQTLIILDPKTRLLR